MKTILALSIFGITALISGPAIAQDISQPNGDESSEWSVSPAYSGTSADLETKPARASFEQVINVQPSTIPLDSQTVSISYPDDRFINPNPPYEPGPAHANRIMFVLDDLDTE